MNERSVRFRKAITDFIDERRDTKLGTVTAERRDATEAKYEYSVWLADAAHRVKQIQAVTHVLKATHPDAKGTSLRIGPSNLTHHEEVGSHCLSRQVDDVVGNAAALDVYKFLKLEVDDCQLLSWLQEKDKDLLAALTALNKDEETSRTWAQAFTGLVRTPEELASHSRAKQLYWSVSGEPADDKGYHLLAPLFSSSLAHVVHKDVEEARYGETNTEARRARREGNAHDNEYREYRQLAARKLGGTKPQNISQLNSERRGENYLLASLPPNWDQTRPRQFLFTNSALSRFRYYHGVGVLLNNLQALLKSDPKAVMETRTKREDIEKALGQSLAAFGAEVRETFEPGWSMDMNCRLPLCEKIWLDAERTELAVREDHAEIDQAFIDAYEWQDWPNEVAHRYASWLNDVLRHAGLPVGDTEHTHWAKQAIIDVEWPGGLQRRVASDRA